MRRAREDLERRLGLASIVVVLLGAGGRGLEERRLIAEELERMGAIALVPEDDFPDVAPSVIEEVLLERGDVDLIFVSVESWGSVAEFSQFHDRPSVGRKLRVLVPGRHHPLYGEGGGYLTDLYLTHLVKYGHVYAFGRDGGPFPSPRSIAVKIAGRHMVLAAFGKL